MQHYSVTGMSCSACSLRVEKAVSALDGVETCSVNLITNSLSVTGNVSYNEIKTTVEALGYGIENPSGVSSKVDDDFLADTESPRLLKRLISSLGFLILLMYVSMGSSMFSAPLPSFFSHNPLATALLQLVLCSAIMVINQKFFIGGFKAVLNKSPNMDTLVALGSGAAFIYSLYTVFQMTKAYTLGDISGAHIYLHDLYFESAAMILSLITVGKMLEAYSKGRTTNALKSLIKLKPNYATIIKDGEEIKISADSIKVDDIFVVKAGESFVTDGIILEGNCLVNEAALTGESMPIDKFEGDNVSAATINISGYVKCRATKVSEENSLAQIIKLVSDASSTKAPISYVADKVSGVFVPIVIAISLISTFSWLLLGKTLGFALARGISVLVISCPCALGLATPVAIMVGSGVGAKCGILFKTASALEESARIKIVALDKTGTITTGSPTVTDIIPSPDISEEKLLQLAYSLEAKSEHPLAMAISSYAKDKNISPLLSTDFVIIPGSGLTARIDNSEVCGGNLNFISKKCNLSDDIIKIASHLADMGKTPMFFSCDEKFLGTIAVMDTIKDDSRKAISKLKNMGIKTVMLTGDNIKTATRVKELCNIDEVVAEVMPGEKEEFIRKLKKRGKVLMVGDGINDAPALTSADIGMAIGSGTDIAIESADVVLTGSSLLGVATAIRLGRATLQNIRENLFWAFIYNVIGIPLAAGVFIPLFSFKLSPSFGAAAMSLSSFCVVLNALRLNLFKTKSENLDKKFIQKENKPMEKTIKIDGLMCSHCEARVKQALEALDGVSSVEVSHKDGNAKITLIKEISDAVIKSAIEEQGYKVL